MKNPFYDPKVKINTRTGEQAYQDYLDRMKNEKQAKPVAKKTQATVNTPVSAEFSLEDLTDFWQVNGVNYRDGIYQIDLAKTLLDNGNNRTQNEWVEYSKKAIARNEFYVGDFPLYHSLFSVLFRNKENTKYKDRINDVKELISKNMFNYWLMTLTRIEYKPSWKDKVIHNYGMQDQYGIQEDIVGKDDYITQINPQNELKAILGSDNINEINQVYNWITGKNAYLWRINKKPEKYIERVAWFGASSGRAGLDCYRDPDDSNKVLGVRAKLSEGKNEKSVL